MICNMVTFIIVRMGIRDCNGQFLKLLFFSIELCWGKAVVAYRTPQQWKKEESERLRGREIRSSLLILDLKEGKL